MPLMPPPSPCPCSSSNPLAAPASFSSYGTKTTHIYAPGEQIFAPQWLPDMSPYPYIWRAQTGTSSAAPYVTATAALVLNINPSLTPVQVW